jgi:hypothetical protein
MHSFILHKQSEAALLIQLHVLLRLLLLNLTAQQDVGSVTERMRAALSSGQSEADVLAMEQRKLAAKKEVEDDGW